MANINIKFNNNDYLLSCDDGQEESLKKLTKYLDRKYTELKDKLGNIGENKLLLITTIQLIDEYFDLKQKVTLQKKKIDDLANKFKELKKLAIEYKEGKDKEINKLNDELDKFKKVAVPIFCPKCKENMDGQLDSYYYKAYGECVNCRAATETKLKTGYRFIDNNFVNFIANLAGSLAIILISLTYG